ncbi:MAG: hypothetical protein KGQ59_10425 [Bdellovibrionales bacterium]|nr:hypothetical protein [Bdellovibrionales bacterium]
MTHRALAFFSVFLFWGCSGDNGSSPVTQSVSGTGFVVKRYEKTSTAGKNFPFSVSCASGETLLAGGCSCANGGGITSSIRTKGQTAPVCACETDGCPCDNQPSPEGWACSCDSAPTTGTHKVVALCTPTTGFTRTEDLQLNATQASCGAPAQRLGGGVLCGANVNVSTVLNRIGFSSTVSTRGECKTGTPTQVSAQCVSPAPTLANSSDQTTPMSGSTFTSTQSCGTGEVLVGGECDCPNNETLFEFYPTTDMKTLQCKCSNAVGSGSLTSKVLCAQ